MEANNNVSDENCKKGFVADVEEEDVETLKRRISSHPLYGLLIQTHLNCLKQNKAFESWDHQTTRILLVSLGEVGEVGTTDAANLNQATIPSSSSELDLFMEAYCAILSKLKEAIEEPVKETESFIDATYVQLRELREDAPK
ncbi:homeobox protein knotted-1-like 2 [Citrus sinensis]|uniref:homeobox protein knotted-1-like 2 n=1 Tax=Citrus sinensis TaxID=2711 RepID=UPI0003D78011|nr:homeobox protein knotted-1-like 2 [Citrus sinensis]